MFGSFGSSGSLGMGIMMSLEDGFSGAAGTIEKSMKNLADVSDDMVARVTKGLGQMKAGLMLAGVGIGLLITLGLAVDKAADMSDMMADVRKTTGQTTDEVRDMRNSFMDIDTRSSTAELMKIAQIGGQIGVAKTEIQEFTKSIDMANVALGDEFSGGAEEITKSLGTIKNLFQETKNMKAGEAMNLIGSAINSLGAAGQATGPNISNFVSRIGQLGAMAPALRESLALGATLQEVGIEGQVGAGGLTTLITEVTELTKQHNRLKDFAAQMGLTQEAAKAMFNQSRGDFIMNLAKSFKGLDAYTIGNKLKGLGLAGSEVQRVFGALANGTELYADRLKIVDEQLLTGASLTEEFTIKNQTLGAVIDKMGESWNKVVVVIGEAAAPIFSAFYEVFADFMDIIRRFVQTDAGKFIIKVVAIGAVLLTFVGTILLVKGAMTALGAIMPAVGAAIWTALAPLAPFIAVGIALAGVIYFAKRSFDEFTSFLEGKEKAADGFLGMMQRIGAVVWTVAQVWKSWNGETFDLGGMEEKLKQMGILDMVLSIGTWVVRIKEFLGGMLDGFKSVFIGVRDIIMWAWEKIQPIFDTLGINITKLGGSLDKFALAGKILGGVIAVSLLPPLIGMGLIFVAMAIPIGVVVGLIWSVYTAVNYLYDALHSFNIGDLWDSMIAGLELLALNFVDFGKSIVTNILNGIKENWGDIVSWMYDKMGFLSPLGVPDAGFSGGSVQPSRGGASNVIQNESNYTNALRAQPMKVMGGNTTSNHYNGPGSANISINLDGKQIGEAMADFNDMTDSQY